MIGGIGGSNWSYYGMGNLSIGQSSAVGSGIRTSGLTGASGAAEKFTGDGVILELSDEGKKAGKKVLDASGSEECQTCKERKYKDGSDENVSFKAAAHISPEASASRVMSHEKEHVANAYEKAAKGNGKVISASVSIHTEICPECGRSFVAGGETNTKIKYSNEENPYQQQKKSQDAISLIGARVDYVA